MSKHTPGPWLAREWYDIDHEGECQAQGWDLRLPNGFRLPLCSNTSGDLSEAEANARLIAAAPRLLQALKKIVQCEKRRAADLRHRGAWMLVKFSEERVAEAEAAIREAEGRQ